MFRLNLYFAWQLVGKEIQNVAGSARTAAPVKLGVTASFARNCSKTSVLNIKILGKSSAGGSYLIRFVFPAAALWAVITFLHDF